MPLPFSFASPFGDADLYSRLRQEPEYEFGTGSGRQGQFNPRNPRQVSMALQRLQELQEQYGERLEPQYTGYTGLSPGDASGYSAMLNARTEAGNIQRILRGLGPYQVEFGGVMTKRRANPMQFMKRYGR